MDGRNVFSARPRGGDLTICPQEFVTLSTVNAAPGEMTYTLR
jgi:hypothetical protein